MASQKFGAPKVDLPKSGLSEETFPLDVVPSFVLALLAFGAVEEIQGDSVSVIRISCRGRSLQDYFAIFLWQFLAFTLSFAAFNLRRKTV